MIQPDTGGPALSRRGDFEVSNLGELTDGAGAKILDNNLNPINIPPIGELLFRRMEIYL